jgi:hypothetical protein
MTETATLKFSTISILFYFQELIKNWRILYSIVKRCRSRIITIPQWITLILINYSRSQWSAQVKARKMELCLRLLWKEKHFRSMGFNSTLRKYFLNGKRSFQELSNTSAWANILLINLFSNVKNHSTSLILMSFKHKSFTTINLWKDKTSKIHMFTFGSDTLLK